ncbi:Transcriptional regulatory protein RcsB [compost metagenome]
MVTDLFGNQETISTQVEALHQFHKAHPLTKVVVYTSVRDSKVLFFLRHILEFSVISRQEPIDDIYDYIRLAVSGEYISSPLIVKLIDELPHSDSFITVNLTRNENEVLSFYLEGMNLTQIARMKNRSIKTVSAQKCSGMRKLGVSNDADLFLFKSKVLTNLRFNH